MNQLCAGLGRTAGDLGLDGASDDGVSVLSDVGSVSGEATVDSATLGPSSCSGIPQGCRGHRAGRGGDGGIALPREGGGAGSGASPCLSPPAGAAAIGHAAGVLGNALLPSAGDLRAAVDRLRACVEDLGEDGAELQGASRGLFGALESAVCRGGRSSTAT